MKLTLKASKLEFVTCMPSGQLLCLDRGPKVLFLKETKVWGYNKLSDFDIAFETAEKKTTFDYIEP